MSTYHSPVHMREDGKFYFYHETWAHWSGPFDTAEIAEEELTKYCYKLLAEEDAVTNLN